MKNMSKFSRFTSAMLVILLIILPLTGCHGAKGLAPFVIPEVFDESKPYEITFWAKNDTNKTQTDIYEKAIADFQQVYPNITVNLRLYTDYGRIYNDVITNIATGTTPNVCITYPDHIATYMTGANVVVPLDQLMTHEKYGLGGANVRFSGPTAEEIVPKFLKEGQIGGVQYALPYMRSTEACYINKTYVEKLGYTIPEKLTWDFVWEVADAATKQDEDGNYLVNGQKVMIPFIYKSTDNMMIQMLRQKGADYSTAQGDIGIFNETTAELLFEIAEHVQIGAFSTFKISSYPANFLNAGQCIFAIDSTAGATWMGTDAPLSDISEENLVRFETVVKEIPQFDPDNPTMISQGPSVCLFNKEDPGEVLASWLFTQFLLTNNVQIAYAQTEGYVPVTTKAQQSDQYQDYLRRAGEDNDLHYPVKLAATQLLLNHIDDTFVTPVFNGSASLRDAAGALVENVTKSVRRKEVVDQVYMEELYAEMHSLYRLDRSSTATGGLRELGPMPAGSIALLTGLAVVWCAIIGGLVYGKYKQNRQATGLGAIR